MSFGFARRPSPAQQRQNKARRLVNLSIHEVSSVDRGAGPGCEVKLLKRDEGVEKMDKRGGSHHPVNDLPHDKHAMDLNTAYRVSKLMSLDKLFKDHSAGKIDGALMSEGIRKLADAEFPNDKLAMAKYEKAHREEFANKLRSDYARQQKDGYGSALGAGPVWNGAVGSGVGDHPDVKGNDYYTRTAANVDGTRLPTSVGTSLPLVDTSKRYANAITKDNIDVLMKRFGLNFDQAATMLARGGK
jgi:hypothetical protein